MLQERKLPLYFLRDLKQEFMPEFSWRILHLGAKGEKL